jgi:hypothetical protein
MAYEIYKPDKLADWLEEHQKITTQLCVLAGRKREIEHEFDDTIEQQRQLKNKKQKQKHDKTEFAKLERHQLRVLHSHELKTPPKYKIGLLDVCSDDILLIITIMSGPTFTTVCNRIHQLYKNNKTLFWKKWKTYYFAPTTKRILDKFPQFKIHGFPVNGKPLTYYPEATYKHGNQYLTETGLSDDPHDCGKWRIIGHNIRYFVRRPPTNRFILEILNRTTGSILTINIADSKGNRIKYIHNDTHILFTTSTQSHNILYNTTTKTREWEDYTDLGYIRQNGPHIVGVNSIDTRIINGFTGKHIATIPKLDASHILSVSSNTNSVYILTDKYLYCISVKTRIVRKQINPTNNNNQSRLHLDGDALYIRYTMSGRWARIV